MECCCSATLDIKKKVGDVSIEPRDLYMAVIENGGGNGGVFLHESGICKIYEVGVPREPDQEDEVGSANKFVEYCLCYVPR